MIHDAGPHWLEGHRARASFRVLAYITTMSVVVLAFMLALTAYLGATALQPFVRLPWTQAFGFVFGIISALSAICLWLGMLWHLTAVNRIRTGINYLWEFFLILRNWLAALIYYALRYRK